MHFISARHGTGVGELARDVVRGYDAAMRDMPTPQLTRVLEKAIEAHQPPLVQGPAHQAALCAPGRAQSAAHHHPRQPDRVGARAYRRYLANVFREAFDLYATPVAVEFRTDANPYDRLKAGKRPARDGGRNNAGSTKARLSATPKCRCGPVTRPVAPTAPMTLAARCSASPGFTSMRDRWQYIVISPAPWSISTVLPLKK